MVKYCLAVGFSIRDIRSMISKNGIPKDEPCKPDTKKLRRLKPLNKN
ncbi:hypothetical protein NYE69_02360 [Paenibacillus sp. FSL R5-0527]|nr:hypothetical protein [Paenibacillus macerans]